MTFINSGYMVGLLIGSMAFGVISDKFGRRKALILGAVMSGCISVAQSFVKNYWLYFVLRLLLGISAKGLFMIAFMICVEISGVDYKTTLGILIQVSEIIIYISFWDKDNRIICDIWCSILAMFLSWHIKWFTEICLNHENLIFWCLQILLSSEFLTRHWSK